MKNLLLASVLFFSLSACENLEVDSETSCTGELKSISKTSSQKDDEALLKQLGDEIITLSKSATCSASAKYSFTAFGSKACGGPAGYIAYDTSIDTECFLKKTDHFKQQSIEFNTKHGAISDCMLLTEPKSVACEGGKIVFKY